MSFERVGLIENGSYRLLDHHVSENRMAEAAKGRDRPPESYLWDMLTAARAVVEFIRGRTFEEYERYLLLRSAVERQIEIIGDAARYVSATFQ